MKIPQAWAKDGPTTLKAFRSLDEKPTTRLVADAAAAPSAWWSELSDASKEAYVQEHPNSKYADFHRKEKADKGTDSHNTSHQSHEGGEHEPSAPKAEAPKKAWNKTDHLPPRPTKDNVDLQQGSPKRKAAVTFLRKKTAAIISHLKHEAHEWKEAGHALKGLATGKGLDSHGKKAIGSVAADLAAVTASILVTGGAAHGIVAFLHHFGSHLAQEMLIKAAIKGAATAANVITSSSEEDDIMERALKMMMDTLENGDLQKVMDDADKEGKELAQASVAAQSVKAKLDMSAEVAGKGLCPECKNPMVTARAGGYPSWSCRACRVSIPLPNDHEQNQQESGPLV